MDSGPAAELMLDAYHHLRLVRHSFNRSADRPETQRSLAFLRRLGGSPGVGIAAIDCTRFLLLSLQIFEKAPTEFGRHHEDFWPVCGAMAGEAISRVGRTHIEVRPDAICSFFVDKFSLEDTPWDIRAHIVNGFIDLATRMDRRAPSFWSSLDSFLERCETGPAPHIKASAEALVKLWWNLTRKYPKDVDVRDHMVRVASRLLDLMIRAQLTYPVAWTWWKEALQSLELPVADPLKSERIPRDSAIQGALEQVATRLMGIELEVASFVSKRQLKELRDEIIPYLHGLKRAGKRVPLPDYYMKSSAVFRLSANEVVRTTVCIKDVCVRTCRGFRIEADGLRIPEGTYYDGSQGISGSVDKRPCRTVVAWPPNSAQAHAIDGVDLELSYPNRPHVEVIPCRIVRAWPRSPTGSGWALLADPDFGVSETWREFLTDLYDQAEMRLR